MRILSSIFTSLFLLLCTLGQASAQSPGYLYHRHIDSAHQALDSGNLTAFSKHQKAAFSTGIFDASDGLSLVVAAIGLGEKQTAETLFLELASKGLHIKELKQRLQFMHQAEGIDLSFQKHCREFQQNLTSIQNAWKKAYRAPSKEKTAGWAKRSVKKIDRLERAYVNHSKADRWSDREDSLKRSELGNQMYVQLKSLIDGLGFFPGERYLGEDLSFALTNALEYLSPEQLLEFMPAIAASIQSGELLDIKNTAESLEYLALTTGKYIVPTEKGYALRDLSNEVHPSGRYPHYLGLFFDCAKEDNEACVWFLPPRASGISLEEIETMRQRLCLSSYTDYLAKSSVQVLSWSAYMEKSASRWP